MKTLLFLAILLCSGLFINEKTELLDFDLPVFQNNELIESHAIAAVSFDHNRQMRPSNEAVNSKLKRMGVQIFKKILLPLAGLALLLWGLMLLGIFNSIKKL